MSSTPSITSFIRRIMDAATDMTGIMNRDRGTYKYMRAGVLGYFHGGNGICSVLDEDQENCDSYWSILNPFNDHKMGKTIRGGNNNPLWDR